jgi:hypothetical protein
MITNLRETSVLKEIAYLDPEMNGDAEYFRIRARRIRLWHEVRQFISSPVVLTLSALIVLLILAASVPS